jgi:wyosine [tRNA(Phe)-imidazoG37] synthetase (radical SAM superfamily)
VFHLELLKKLNDIEFNQLKYITHFDKIKKLSEEKDVYPVTIEIDPVAYCNHNCSWCVDPKHFNDKLETEFIFTLLKEIKNLGVKGIVFKGGGEPMLHPDFGKILQKTKNLGFETGIVTNGSKLTQLYNEIAEYANYIRISLDGPTQESHKKTHKVNDFNEIIEGIKKLVKTRNTMKKRHPIIGISFAMDYNSINLIKKAIILGDELKVDYVFFRTPFYEEVCRKSTMTIKESFKLKNKFETEAKKYKGKMNIFIDNWISDKESKKITPKQIKNSPRRGNFMCKGANGIEHITKTCLATPLLCVISANKKIYPCCNLRFLDEWNIGEIDYNKGNTFKKNWNSKKRKKILKKIKKIKCIKYCTHPMSKYNEIINYLQSEKYHSSFI